MDDMPSITGGEIDTLLAEYQARAPQDRAGTGTPATIVETLPPAIHSQASHIARKSAPQIEMA